MKSCNRPTWQWFVRFGLVLTALGVFWAPPLAFAGKLRIRLATLAPKDTSFHKSLLAMGEQWRRASSGEVALTIYADGTMGGEADMVRRIRVGQLQAAMLSGAGLLQIDESVTVLQLLPMMFRSFDELDYVRDRLRPMLEQRMLDKGFVVLFWGDAGWVRLFSTRPASRPEEFKRLKMFVWAGNPKVNEVMKTIGINGVPLEQTDILTGLQTGLIEAVDSIPVFALAGQFYRPAPYMLDIDWAPLLGATVISKRTWDSVPAPYRAALLKAAREAGDQICKHSRLESQEAVRAMEQRGLKVQELTPELRAEWRKFAQDVYPELRGRIVPEDLFDEVQRLLREYRSLTGKAEPVR